MIAYGAGYVVNSTSDRPEVTPDDGICDTGNTVTVDGSQVPECTLRAAIQEASASSNGVSTIKFDIPGGGVPVITVPDFLPHITQPVVIDGTSQPGGSVKLEGPCLESIFPATSRICPGLYIAAGGTTVKGLDLDNFFAGIVAADSGGDTIQGNTITSNQVGGCDPSENQIYSSDLYNQSAIGVTGPNDQIIDNQIQVGSFYCGIVVGGGVPAIPYGNQTPANGDTIQGNAVSHVAGGSPPPGGTGGDVGIVVVGGQNTIGANILTGWANGIAVSGSLGVGEVPADHNLIQGNQLSRPSAGGDGIGIDSADNTVQQNTVSWSTSMGSIGIAVTGDGNAIGGATDQLGNTVSGGGPGLTSGAAEGGVSIDGANNAVEHNTITGSTGSGVTVAHGDHNLIRANVFSNDQPLAIDLGADGPTPNDATQSLGTTLPGPSSANDRQNFPVLTDLTVSGNTVSVSGIVDSAANSSYTLEFYMSASCGQDGRGQGQFRLGTKTVNTNASGLASFSFSLDGSGASGALGGVVSATATNSSNDTSEMSPCRSQLAPAGTLGAPTSVTYNASNGLKLGGLPGLSPASTLQVPPGSLPDGTTFNLYPVQSNSQLQSSLPAGQSFLSGFALTWFAPDGTVPQAKPGSPIILTILDPSIQSGDTVYIWTAQGLQPANATVTNGQAVITITSDPTFIIATPSSPGGGGGGGVVNLGGGGLNFVSAPAVDRGCQASTISSHGASLSALVNPDGEATSAYFQYATSTSYGSQTTSQQLGPGFQADLVKAALGDLTAASTYHCRVVATNSAGTTYGQDQIFQTLAAGAPAPPPPSNAQRVNPHLHLAKPAVQTGRACTAKAVIAHASETHKRTCQVTVTLTGTIDPRADGEEITLLLHGSGGSGAARATRQITGRISGGHFKLSVHLSVPAGAGTKAWTFTIDYPGDHALLPATAAGGFKLRRGKLRHG